MNSLLKLLLLISLLQLFTMQAFAEGQTGGGEAHGGESLAAEMREAKHLLSLIIQQHYRTLFGPVSDGESLLGKQVTTKDVAIKALEALQRLRIVHTRHIHSIPGLSFEAILKLYQVKDLEDLFTIEGEKKEAVTLSALSLTLIDEKAWTELHNQPLRKARLLLHELFCYMEIEHNDFYEISNRLTLSMWESLQIGTALDQVLGPRQALLLNQNLQSPKKLENLLTYYSNLHLSSAWNAQIHSALNSKHSRDLACPADSYLRWLKVSGLNVLHPAGSVSDFAIKEVVGYCWSSRLKKYVHHFEADYLAFSDHLPEAFSVYDQEKITKTIFCPEGYQVSVVKGNPALIYPESSRNFQNLCFDRAGQVQKYVKQLPGSIMACAPVNPLFPTQLLELVEKETDLIVLSKNKIDHGRPLRSYPYLSLQKIETISPLQSIEAWAQAFRVDLKGQHSQALRSLLEMFRSSCILNAGINALPLAASPFATYQQLCFHRDDHQGAKTFQNLLSFYLEAMIKSFNDSFYTSLLEYGDHYFGSWPEMIQEFAFIRPSKDYRQKDDLRPFFNFLEYFLETAEDAPKNFALYLEDAARTRSVSTVSISSNGAHSGLRASSYVATRPPIVGEELVCDFVKSWIAFKSFFKNP